VFPDVKDAAIADAAFALFDASGAGLVSFRDFCRALGWCVPSVPDQKKKTMILS
jgi:hypothetical protein